ncbi:hypothetical protein GGI25_002371 [Coemansia spiralis]|uniref:DUF4246 domain-containing protein n=2 Tax=Coemansia TaxID=4863 RepID=A0A9W8KZ39_9FUNG|nr:hypothetical protein EDC05_003547 [Coemansia umbellata]KAJ2622176.1 hypothetical protein GGI26_003471 [Coemansia sp. RSA 1358]KAJ2678386.1 hypothetical protein GGI25_002371 [Coemansia spiralis]
MVKDTSAKPLSYPIKFKNDTVDKLIRRKYGPGPIYVFASNMLNTRSEKRIRTMIGAIRIKPNWIVKMHDPEIRARWVAEAKSQGLTDKEISYTFDELEFDATLHDRDSGIYLSAVDSVWVSDSLIGAETTNELKRHIAILENVPEMHKDWHPNTNNQVLNLIHPSLFPLIYGRTMLVDKPIESPEAALRLESFGVCPATRNEWESLLNEDMKEVELSPWGYLRPPLCFVPGEPNWIASYKFCWLPTEFDVDELGTAKIISYINNLHPIKHAALYPVIATIFTRFVPLLENTVTDIVHRRDQRVVPDPYNWLIADEPQPEDYNVPGYHARYSEWERNRKFVEPQPGAFIAPERPAKPYSLRGRRLQAIVKMSNILLTPDNPEYKGGSWHVEAMTNERIIATGIYYYDVENITESHLNFRENVDNTLKYLQGDRDGMNRAYGIYEGENRHSDQVPLIQDIGQVEAKSGRCIVFPNIYQHQVAGFKLADPRKPGHRKILAFFFVDPAIRIPSTEIVPPQQRDWWAQTLEDVEALRDLPDLVKNMVIDNVDYPISFTEAKELRLELMAERSTNNSKVNGSFFTPEFYLCEH